MGKLKRVICWWSGGITSAVACKIAIDLYGRDACEVLMIDTKNEHEDTYRFKKDCESWYDLPINVISAVGTELLGYKVDKIQDVWRRYKSLNVAHGAICSSDLKRRVREIWQKENEYDAQVFGFEFDKKEFNRSKSIKLNHPKSKGIYPLLMLAYDKEDCIKIVQEAGIEPPVSYKLGFNNNNCLQTGCVQGGIGYWQKMERDFPEKFKKMADMEHELTEVRGEPVTMLKDQSNDAKKVVKETGIKWKQYVFLRKHPDYPGVKCLADMKPQEVKPLMECNGFCVTNDLNPRNPTEQEINFID